MERGDPPGYRPPHVLVVEDDQMLRFQIARAIREMGWTASELGDGRELLTRLDLASDESPAGVLITDLHMPHVDGMDVLATLSRQSRKLCIVVVTAFADEPTRQRLSALGARMVFSKPFDIDDLCTALMFVCGERGA